MQGRAGHPAGMAEGVSGCVLPSGDREFLPMLEAAIAVVVSRFASGQLGAVPPVDDVDDCLLAAQNGRVDELDES
jgi:hypothetical protein